MESNNSNGRFKIDCPICLQEYVNPVQLPCNHIFCYLCIKGAANSNNRCALCRKDIPDEFFEKPFLLEKEDEIEIAQYDHLYHWYYESRTKNGWWLYDQRTSEDIEIAFKKGIKQTELLIAGNLYIIDFETMMQFRRNDAHRRRKIKRDTKDNNLIKGVSGIFIGNEEAVSTDGHNLTPNDLSPSEALEPETPTAPEEILVNHGAQVNSLRANTHCANSNKSNRGQRNQQAAASQPQTSKDQTTSTQSANQSNLNHCNSNNSNTRVQSTSTHSFSNSSQRLTTEGNGVNDVNVNDIQQSLSIPNYFRETLL